MEVIYLGGVDKTVIVDNEGNVGTFRGHPAYIKFAIEVWAREGEQELPEWDRPEVA